MFSIDFEEKQDTLYNQLSYIKKHNTVIEVNDTIRDLEKKIGNIRNLTDVMDVEDEIKHLNEALGNPLKDYDPFEEDSEVDLSEEEAESDKEVTCSQKHVKFDLPMNNKSTVVIHRYNIINYNVIGRTPKKDSLEFITKQLDIMNGSTSKKKAAITEEFKSKFIQLIRNVELTLLDPQAKYKWFNVVNEFQEMTLEDMFFRFAQNNIYQLDNILEMEYNKVSIVKHSCCEKIFDMLQDFEELETISCMIEIEEKLEEFLGTLLVKYKIIEILKDIHEHTMKFTKRIEKKEYLNDEITRLYQLICKTKTDYHNKNLLKVLLEKY